MVSALDKLLNADFSGEGSSLAAERVLSVHEVLGAISSTSVKRKT